MLTSQKVLNKSLDISLTPLRIITLVFEAVIAAAEPSWRVDRITAMDLVKCMAFGRLQLMCKDV